MSMKYLSLIILCFCFLVSCYPAPEALEITPFDAASTEDWLILENIDLVPTNQTGIYKVEALATVRKEFLPERLSSEDLSIKVLLNGSNFGTIQLVNFSATISEVIYSGKTRCYNFQLVSTEGEVSRKSNDLCATGP